MRWKSRAIALLSLVCGLLLWRFAEGGALLQMVDRAIQQAIVQAARIPVYPPVPITLIDMEDAENWTSLEYSLFLKALPKKNPPVVLLESLPLIGTSAFDRAFQEFAITQSRLVLPVVLSTVGEDDPATLWWLKGWDSRKSEKPGLLYHSVDDGLPETLRGTVSVGVANPPEDARRAPLFFPLEKKNIPSLALRAALLIRRISDDHLRWETDLLLGRERLALDSAGTIALSAAFLPSFTRIAASDLLLGLEKDTATVGPARMNYQGVLILGDLSAKARTVPFGSLPKIAPAEATALALAALCNHPVLTPLGTFGKLVLLICAASAPLLFARRPGLAKWSGLLFVLILLAAAALYLAWQHALATPLAIPLLVLTIGTALQHLTVSQPPPLKHARTESH